MVDRNSINQKIMYGKGKAANVLGSPHSVYRVAGSSSGNYLGSGNNVAIGVHAIWRPSRIIPGANDTQTRLGSLLYEIVADLRLFQIGDVFVNTDSIYNAGSIVVPFATNEFHGFALAMVPAIKKVVGARLSLVAKVYRMSKDPTAKGHFTPTILESGLPLDCAAGAWSLGSVGGPAAFVPMSIVPTGHSEGDKEIMAVPAMPRKSVSTCYVPSLNGFKFRIGDKIVTQDDVRYKVIVAYQQDAGITGSQLLLEREVDQGG